jgi:hypothetical protein
MNPPAVFGPDPLLLDGRWGWRYWVHHPFAFTGHAETDDRLSGYPVAVFLPERRPALQTPVLIGLQGLAAPYQWNGFLVSTLLDMGIACILFDMPLAGERSLARNSRGSVLSEIMPLLDRGVVVKAGILPLLMAAVARDCATVLQLVRQRHNLYDERLALFGVSMGVLLTGFAFLRDGLGMRLLGTLGHLDLRRFARSYAPFFTPLLVSPPGRLLGRVATLVYGSAVPAALGFLDVLNELRTGGPHCDEASPITYLDRLPPGRRVRLLVGREDPLVDCRDAAACSQRFADGECYVVPGLAHGHSRFGPSFCDHARFFVVTQLEDWRG